MVLGPEKGLPEFRASCVSRIQSHGSGQLGAWASLRAPRIASCQGPGAWAEATLVHRCLHGAWPSCRLNEVNAQDGSSPSARLLPSSICLVGF